MTNTIAQERRLTEAERADEDARIERALTGQLRGRTLHAICEQSARLIECQHCGARPGKVCRRGGGYHLARFVRAYVRGLIIMDEMVTVLGGLDVFTAATIIRDAR